MLEAARYVNASIHVWQLSLVMLIVIKVIDTVF